MLLRSTWYRKHSGSSLSSKTQSKEESVINKKTKQHIETADGQNGGTPAIRNAGFQNNNKKQKQTSHESNGTKK